MFVLIVSFDSIYFKLQLFVEVDIDPEVASPLITDNPDGKSPLQLDIAKVRRRFGAKFARGVYFRLTLIFYGYNFTAVLSTEFSPV